MNALSGHRPWIRKRRRLAMAVAGLAVLGLGGFLVLKAIEDSLLYFHLPSDVVERQVPVGQAFRLGGLVAQGSIEQLGDDASVRFTVTDNETELAVVYRGILPDLFREGQGVIADGALTPEGHFAAETVLAKHDENYMPKDVYERLQERGHPSDVAAAK